MQSVIPSRAPFAVEGNDASDASPSRRHAPVIGWPLPINPATDMDRPSDLSARRKGTLATPRPLRLYRRRWTAYFSLTFAVVLCVSGLTIAVVAASIPTASLRYVMWIVVVGSSLAIAASLANGALKALTSKDPVLTFDDEGVTHVDGDSTFLAWSEIARISTTHNDGDRLGIWFTRSSAYHQETGALKAIAQRALSGADMSIRLGDLVYNPTELKKTVAAYHLQAHPPRHPNL